jgi:hypothetical protein
MNEFLAKAEVLTKLGIPLVSPEQINSASLEWLENFCAGCSTLSLNYLVNGLLSRNASIPPYVSQVEPTHVNMDLTLPAYRRVFNKDPFIPIHTKELIDSNRDHGKWWSVYDMLTNNPTYNKNPLKLYEAAEFDAFLYQFVFAPATLWYEESNPFLDLDIAPAIVAEIRKRPAAQIFYKPEITDFICTKPHKPDDDQAATVYSAIPKKFIQAVSIITHA